MKVNILTFSVEIPSIGINVTDDRVIEAVSVVTSIPFPEGKAPEETSNLTKVLRSTIIVT